MRNVIHTSPPRVLLAGSSLAVFLAIGHTVIDTFTSMLTALLPTIQARFGMTESVLALLVAMLAFSTSVTQPLMGTLSDRFGMRLVGAVGIILNVSLLSLIGVAPSVPLLFALLFVGGLGSAMFHPAGTSLARAAGSKHKGLAVSLFGAGGTIGLALGPVIVLSVVTTFGLSFTPWLMVPGIILGVLTYVVVPPQEDNSSHRHATFLNVRLFRGPVGLLSLAGILSSIAVVTFGSAVPLWLVTIHGVARDSTLIGWTLALFSLSAAGGGILAGVLSIHVQPRLLITGSMLLATMPLVALLALEPGSLPFFLMVMLAGALANASLPLLIVSAQDLAPDDMATASGMLMGFATGTAGVLYIGIGQLQELVGLTTALRVSFLMLIPAALLAWYVLTRYGTPEGVEARASTGLTQRAMAASTTCISTPCVCAQCQSIEVDSDPPSVTR